MNLTDGWKEEDWKREALEAQHEVIVLVECIEKIKECVDQQAEDEGLWSVPWEGLQPISEAYLQKELRRLHAAIESSIVGVVSVHNSSQSDDETTVLQ